MKKPEKSVNFFKGLICLGITGLLCSCSASKMVMRHSIILTNTAAYALTDKPIVIKRTGLGAIPTGKSYPVIRTGQGKIIPAQVDDLNGDKQWDELFMVANLPANSQTKWSITWEQAMPDFTPRTSARFGKRSSATTPVKQRTNDTLYANQVVKKLGYQPYQTDGPNWENDKVGFRHYLDGRNAKDLFGKQVPYMSLENVGLTPGGAVVDNYHVLEPWGRDILAVGNSAGLGGMALLVGNEIARLGVTVDDTLNNVQGTNFNIVTEGPVRSALNFKYNNWQATSSRVYQVNETSSIWPGMYAYQSSVQLSGLKGDESLLVGLVNSNTEHPLTEIRVDNKWVILLTHDKQTYNKQYWLGLALILPIEAYLGYGEAPKTGKFSTSYYGKLKIKNNLPVSYYAIGCWELSDTQFKDPVYFQKYVTELAHQLTAKVKISIK